MSSMRKVALTVAGFGLTQLLLGALTAGPADAHGALSNPLSRAAACGTEGGKAAVSKACKAAVARSDAGALKEWDELRVPNVAGRDRQMIPDGKLCSAGLPPFAGLDLPRADWPATTLTAGARYTFKYRATIPHQGTFRMYITKDGYDPARPLAWSALESKPFLKVTDPALAGGAYTMKGRLPSGKTGRHLIYTVWQNSDTPDTYYSCSDIVFTANGGGDQAASAGGGVAGSDAAATPAPQAALSAGTRRPAESRGEGASATLVIGGAAVALLACAGAAMLLARRSDRRA